MPPPKTHHAETQFEREQDESRAVDCINVLLAQPPGSPRQYEAGQRLLGLIFVKIDQLCRRRYLPDDEAELAALGVVERIRRNDFHNLRAFARWHSVVDRSEVRLLRELRAAPARTFDNWLRQLCRWEVRRRLRPFCRASSFDEVDVATLPDPDVLCPELRLIERELRSQEGAIMDLALEALDDRQRAALRAYARRGDEAAMKGEKHARTKRCYDEIAAALGLRDARAAAEFVRAARQRLLRALRRIQSRRKP